MSIPKATGNTPLWQRFAPLVIVLLGILLYANTYDVPFIFDDQGYIVENPSVRDFRYYADSALAERAIAQDELYPNFRTRKLAFFTFALNYMLHGMDVRGFHAVNLLIHLACGLLVYTLVLATLRTPFFRDGTTEIPPGYGQAAALLTALFFVAHPVQTQAVTYLSQRFTSMATMLYLLALVLYVRWRLGAEKSGGLVRWLPYGLALLATLAAMLTKEIAFTLPVTIILYEWMFFGRPGRATALALLPFLVTMLIIPAVIFAQATQYTDVETLSVSLSQSEGENVALSYLVTQFRVIVTYIRLLLFPLHQNLDYDYPQYTSLLQPPALASFIFLCLLAGLALILLARSIRQPRDRGRWLRLVSFGILWFFVTLSVESSVLPLGDLIFEHRIYLPSVGFFLALLGVLTLTKARMGRHAMLLIPILLVILGGLSGATVRRNNLWRDPIAFWEDTVRKSPGKGRPHYNLGEEYLAMRRIAEARGQFEKAHTLYKHYEELLHSYRNLENFYQHLNDNDLIVSLYADWEKFLKNEAGKRRDDPTVFNELGILYWKMGRLAEAESALRKAIICNNKEYSYYFNISRVYLDQGKKDEGIAGLREAARIVPNIDAVQEGLADELTDQGNYDEALTAYLKALDLNPGSTSLYTKIAGEHIRRDRLDEADKVLRRGVAARKDDPWAHNDLGMFLERTGRPAEAEAAYGQALRLDDNIAEVHMNLGLLYLGQVNMDRALASLTRAAELDPANPDIQVALSTARTRIGDYQQQQQLIGRNRPASRPPLKKGQNTNSTGRKKPKAKLG